MQENINVVTEELLASYLQFTGKAPSSILPEDYLKFRKEAIVEAENGYVTQSRTTVKAPATRQEGKEQFLPKEPESTKQAENTAKIMDISDSSSFVDKKKAMQELMQGVKG